MGMEFHPQGAFLIIDMLNDFIDEGGALVVPGARRIVPRIRMLLQEARAQGTPVIYVADCHNEDDYEFRYWSAHAIAGTWGGEIIPELAPQPTEKVIRKRRYSAFFGTDLDIHLREHGIVKLYLTGVLTNICVYATALDAAMRHYQVAVFRDAVASLNEETDAFIFRQLEEVLHAELI